MIADFGDYLRDTNRRFADQHITVDQDWLGGCVEWFLSENPQISNAELYKNAYEQWLLSDLAESGTKCLPQTVQNKRNEFELTGNYALQMQYLIDIAESAYEQYRNMHDKILDEAEEAETEHRQRNISKKKRTLKLELTDGHSNVIAMEHCPISSLNTKLCPGTKILITGPIRCVNKVLFLQPKSVKILGGEVEILSIDNAYENVLLKAMGRPITSTPKLDYKETGVVEQNGPTPILAAVSVAVHNHQPISTNVIHDDDDDLFSNLDIDYLNVNVAASNSTNANQKHATNANRNPTTNINQLLDDDDDIFLEANIPDGSVVETTTNSNAKPNHNTFYDDDDDFDVLEIEANIQMEMPNEERRQLANNQVKEPAVPPSENNEYFDPDFDAIFQNDNVIEEDRVTVSNDITDRNYEFKISGCPLVTILQLHSMDDSDKSERSFILKCEVLKTVESIRIVSNQYHLVVLLRDSTDLDLEVKVSNDVVAKWTDVTAEELQKMRQTIKQRPQQRQQMENILRKLSDTLTEFDGFVRIEYSHKDVRPEVTEVIQNKTRCEEILRKKLAKGV